MVGCNRIIKIIVMTLGIYLLVINVVLWANDPKMNILLLETSTYHYDMVPNYYVFHETKMVNFYGFEWFYNRLSTFPGLQNTVAQITNYGKYISGLSLGKWVLISILETIVKGLVVPFQLLGAIAVDIYNNAKWFLGFIWNL